MRAGLAGAVASGPAADKREDRPSAAPKALSKKAQVRWLQAAEQASARDRAVVSHNLEARRVNLVVLD
jgi:hypothetical protein